MYFTQYQKKAKEYALYQDKFYPVASLMVESAELADELVKPMLRGDDVEIDKDKLLSEAGDVLWNLAMILEDQDISLGDAAEYNLAKLADRKVRGVIKGKGGNR